MDRTLVRLAVDEAQDRLESVARPCLIWGLTALILFGAAHLYYLPRAHDVELLIVTLTRYVAGGVVLWTMQHAAVLWWLRRGGPAGFACFVLLGTLAALAVSLVFWEITRHGLIALVGLVIGGWVFVVELVLALRVLRLLVVLRPLA